MAVTNVIRTRAPSLHVMEKLAISEGENANRARAKFAAPSEKRRLAVIHKRTPRRTPNITMTGRAALAIASGLGVIASAYFASGWKSISVWFRSRGRLHRRKTRGGGGIRACGRREERNSA